jgi:hypothetical protein
VFLVLGTDDDRVIYSRHSRVSVECIKPEKKKRNSRRAQGMVVSMTRSLTRES